MAEQHRLVGKEGYVEFRGTEISADYRSFDVEITTDTVETSAGNQTAKTYITTLRDGTATLTYAYTGTEGTTYTDVLAIGNRGTLQWGEEGSSTGKPKSAVVAHVTSLSRPMTYNELIVRTAQFQFNGALLSDGDAGDTWA